MRHKIQEFTYDLVTNSFKWSCSSQMMEPPWVILLVVKLTDEPG